MRPSGLRRRSALASGLAQSRQDAFSGHPQFFVVAGCLAPRYVRAAATPVARADLPEMVVISRASSPSNHTAFALAEPYFSVFSIMSRQSLEGILVKVLISPVDTNEAVVAWECGTDIIDIKNINEGSLGASFPWVIREVISRVNDSKT